MRKNYLLLLGVTLAFFSCEEKNAEIEKALIGEVKVLQERDPRLPLILTSKPASSIIKSLKTAEMLAPEDYLGRSYNTESGLLGDAECVKFPVIDIGKVNENNPAYITHIALNRTEAKYYSFASFSSYEERKKGSKTVGGGFSFKIPIFSIGASSTATKVFSSVTTISQNTVFGELNILLEGANHEILTTTGAKNKVINEFLHDEFIDQLYSTPTHELIKYIGRFVLVNYKTGGKATALYAGTYSKDGTEQSKEKSMNGAIDATLTYKSVTGGANYSIAKKNDNSTKIDKELTNIQIAVKTVGGFGLFPSFSAPKKIDDISIDLSGWMSSLSNYKSHNLVEINENGLYPIEDFIQELNYKNAFDEYGDLSISPSTSSALQEPIIEISKVSGVFGNDFIQTCMYTRNGHRIYLGTPTNVTDSYVNSDAEFFKKAEIIKDKLSKYYKLKIIAHTSGTEYYPNPEGASISPRPNFIAFFDMDESKMKKFKHPKYKMNYLLFHDGNKKFAYAIYKDFILDTYGIRDLYNRASEVNISLEELNKYAIVGL